MRKKSAESWAALILHAAFFGAFALALRRAEQKRRRLRRAAALRERVLEQLEELP